MAGGDDDPSGTLVHSSSTPFARLDDLVAAMLFRDFLWSIL
jgi:hypothetical protein